MKAYLALVPMVVFSTLFAADSDSDCDEMTSPAPQPVAGCMMNTPKCRDVMFEIFGESLFLQPNGSSLYYSVEAVPLDPAIAVPPVSPNWQVFEISPSYTPAFNVGVKVLFSDMNTNLAVNWERLHTSDSASHSVALATDMIGPISDIGPNSAAYLNANGTATFHFDAVNLVYTQQCCAFKRLYPSFYAGGSFARINQSMTTTYENNAASRSRTISSYSTFTGAGPMVGVDFDYRIVAGFYFTGTSSLGLIIGESQNGTTYTSYSPSLTRQGNPVPNVQATTVPNRTQLVPSIEERLGFSYAGEFDCFKIVFGAGYQAQIYIDAVQSVDMTAPQVLPTIAGGGTVDEGVYAVGFERTLSNFVVTGPYLSLSLIF